jgi:hypothetical protein
MHKIMAKDSISPGEAVYIVSPMTCSGCFYYEYLADSSRHARYCSYYLRTGKHRSGACVHCAEKVIRLRARQARRQGLAEEA